MKKILSITLVGVLLLTLCACSSSGGPISSETLKEALQGYCSADNFTVNTVETTRAQIDEKVCTYDVAATLTAPNAELTRMYRLTYNYYEQGGWFMDECMPINEEQWKAIPTSFNITKEEICDMILTEPTWSDGGYELRIDKGYSGVESTFRSWTRRSSSDLPKTNYLKNYEVVEDFENCKVTITADLEAHSSLIKISETIQIDIDFIPQILKWETEGDYEIRRGVEFKSISSSYEFLQDISGTYVWDDDVLTIEKTGDNQYKISGSYYSSMEFSDAEIIPDGLFVIQAQTLDGYMAYMTVNTDGISYFGGDSLMSFRNFYEKQ